MIVLPLYMSGYKCISEYPTEQIRVFLIVLIASANLIKSAASLDLEGTSTISYSARCLYPNSINEKLRPVDPAQSPGDIRPSAGFSEISPQDRRQRKNFVSFYPVGRSFPHLYLPHRHRKPSEIQICIHQHKTSCHPFYSAGFEQNHRQSSTCGTSVLRTGLFRYAGNETGQNPAFQFILLSKIYRRAIFFSQCFQPVLYSTAPLPYVCQWKH